MNHIQLDISYIIKTDQNNRPKKTKNKNEKNEFLFYIFTFYFSRYNQLDYQFIRVELQIEL